MANHTELENKKPEKGGVEKIDRRRFLIKAGGSAATLTIIGAGISALAGCESTAHGLPGEGTRWSSLNELPNTGDSVKLVEGTRPELTPLEKHYRIINTNVPEVPDMQTWRLKVSGLVEKPISWTINDVKRFTPRSEFVTLTCISNPVGGTLSSTTRWTGVSLQEILPTWKLKEGATHLYIDAADGFFECVALETIHGDPRVMLVYEWDGVPLPIEHGYPLRIYIPNRFGMKQPKWITSIEVTDKWSPGYSVKNTWDKDAIMETTSAIDVVRLEQDENGKKWIQVGGIAHAGSRGISKVQIKVNDGAWEEAQLRKPLSDLTWRVWRFVWPFQEGDHEFTVRAFDKNGVPQKEEVSGPYPDGATGYYSKKLGE